MSTDRPSPGAAPAPESISPTAVGVLAAGLASMPIDISSCAPALPRGASEGTRAETARAAASSTGSGEAARAAPRGPDARRLIGGLGRWMPGSRLALLRRVYLDAGVEVPRFHGHLEREPAAGFVRTVCDDVHLEDRAALIGDPDIRFHLLEQPTRIALGPPLVQVRQEARGKLVEVILPGRDASHLFRYAVDPVGVDVLDDALADAVR